MKTQLFAMIAASALVPMETPVVSSVTNEQRVSHRIEVTYNLLVDAVRGDSNRLVKGAGQHVLYWMPSNAR